MTNAIIETRGLTKRYGSGVLAVDRLDLEVVILDWCLAFSTRRCFICATRCDAHD